MTSEAKVGLLFFIGLGLALWFTFFIGKIGTGAGTYQVLFSRVAKLEDGSPVTYNGVRIGRVRNARPLIVEGAPMVAVGFDLQPQLRDSVLIGPTTRISVDQGFLGGSTVAIVHSGPGQPIRQDLLDPLRGEAPTGIHDTMATVNEVIGENRENLKKAIQGVPQAVQTLTQMAAQIRDLVAENRANVTNSIVAVGQMSAGVAGLVQDNRTTVTAALVRMEQMAAQIKAMVEENRPAVREAAAGLPAAVAAFTGALDQVRSLVAQNRASVGRITYHLASLAPKLDRIGSDLEKITGQVANGQGTVGKMVFEDTLHEKTVAAVENLNQRLEEIKPVTSGLSDLKFFVGLDGGNNVDTGAATAKAYVRIEPRPWKFYEAGVGYRWAPTNRDVAEENPDDLNVDLNATFGWRFFSDDDSSIYRLSLRGGLIESALGLQTDVALWRDRLTWSTMARQKHNDFPENDRRYEDGDVMVRSWLQGRLWRGVSLVAGVDDLVDHPAPWIGLRAELLDNDIRNFIAASSLRP